MTEETTTHTMKPGDEVHIRSEGASRNVKLRFADGTEVDMQVGPNDFIRVKLGQTACDFILDKLGDNPDGLRVIRD